MHQQPIRMALRLGSILAAVTGGLVASQAVAAAVAVHALSSVIQQVFG